MVLLISSPRLGRPCLRAQQGRGPFGGQVEVAGEGVGQMGFAEVEAAVEHQPAARTAGVR